MDMAASLAMRCLFGCLLTWRASPGPSPSLRSFLSGRAFSPSLPFLSLLRFGIMPAGKRFDFKRLCCEMKALRSEEEIFVRLTLSCAPPSSRHDGESGDEKRHRVGQSFTNFFYPLLPFHSSQPTTTKLFSIYPIPLLRLSIPMPSRGKTEHQGFWQWRCDTTSTGLCRSFQASGQLLRQRIARSQRAILA